MPSARRLRRLASRRSRRRPAILATGLAATVIAAALTVSTPTSQAEAAGSAPSFALASYSTPIAAAAPDAAAAAAESVDAPSAADDAIAAAEAALSGAGAVTADISASGLDIGVADTTIETVELEAAVQELQRADSQPDLLVSDVSEVSALASDVDGQVAALRGSLDAAKERKAAEEAAEKARQEAEAAAAAAAAAAQRSSGGGGGGGSAVPVFATGGAVGGTSPADAQATARSMLAGYGWGDDQFGCLVSLWKKESGWNYQAHNSSSGAHGIPQALPGSKMASAGADWASNPATQIAWGLGYISGRYGSPCGAWGHSQSVGWY
jgi:hypothetical protein